MYVVAVDVVVSYGAPLFGRRDERLPFDIAVVAGWRNSDVNEVRILCVGNIIIITIIIRCLLCC